MLSVLLDHDWDTEAEALGLYQDDAAIRSAFAEHGVTVKCDTEHEVEACEKDEGHRGEHRDYQGRTWPQ